MSLVTIVTATLSILTIIGQGIIALSLIAYQTHRDLFLAVIKKHALSVSFIVSLIATSGSLFYSEVAGYTPCTLCWYQRIFMYPQALLLGIAIAKKDENIARYNIALSIVGAIIAAYHYLLQLGIAPGLACATVGYSVSCAQRFVMNFGYITIPMMSLTAFVMILTFMIPLYRQRTAKNSFIASLKKRLRLSH